ncbi:MAG: PASTA domain-containing protein, partial [Syntrophobacteraceae bacterium]
AITGAGLVVGTVTTASSSTVPSGSVISQNPTSGTLVLPGSAVNIVVSTGPTQVAAPNVVGDTQAAAAAAITGAGLVVGTVTTASSSTVPSGSVISQSPTSGTLVLPGSSVNIVVSTGPTQVAAPNVVGDTQAEATTAITGAGLVVGTVTTASSSTVPSGSVISQNPTSGTSVAQGSAVNLVVSSGPAPTGKPEISGQIIAKGMGHSGTVFVDLKLTDTGTADAVNVQMGQLVFRTICGKGTVTYNAALSGKLPLKIGNIKKGASTTVRLFFNVPFNVTGFTFTESGTMQNTVGNNYNYSTTQTVTLCHEWNSPRHFGDCDHDDCGHVCF